VVVQEVMPGIPAAPAGLEGLLRARGEGFDVGDWIVAVNGKPVQSEDDLTRVDGWRQISAVLSQRWTAA
jgi:S1-C subfamily serine protease